MEIERSRIKIALTETSELRVRDDLKDDVKDILEVAENYFASGQMQQAENILQQLLMQETKEPKVYYLLGAIYYDMGKHHRAEIAFKRCLDIDPNYRDATVALTILYNELGEYQKAEETFRLAKSEVEQKNLGKDPHLVSIFAKRHEELGDLYNEHEHFQRAFHEYEKAAEHEPKQLDLVIKAAKALEKSGSRQAAIEKLKELKCAFPEHIATRLALGMLYFNGNLVPEAVSEWEAVLKRDPECREAKLYLKVASQSQVTIR